MRKTLHLWALILAIYIAGVGAYSAYSYQAEKQVLLSSIDQKLIGGAIALAKIAGPKFHEGLSGPESRSPADLKALAKDLTEYCRAANLIYIYSVVLRDGKPFFAAASTGYEREWDTGEWNSFFRPYREPPEELLRTLTDGQTRFAEYKDEYGAFRSVFMAWKTQDGEIWAAGADIKIDDIEALLGRSITHSVAAALYFLLLLAPVSLIYARITGRDKEILEKKVEQRTQELAEANRRLQEQTLDLERSNKELEQYAYVASHDLREPLRMVRSYMTLIERRLGDNLSEEIKTYIGFATDGAKRMDELIRALLEYSRIGKGGMEFKAVNLAQVVAEALASLHDAIDAADASIKVAGDLPVTVGSPIELGRLFQNLIGNAVKYRAAGRKPEIDIGWKSEDGELVVWVTDNGIGIDPKHHERAFGIFQRLVAKEDYEGTGIGLAVCKKIAEQHGGRIWVESQGEDKGTSFFVSLPGATAA